MPRITCPTCGAALEITAEMVGQQVECGSCQTHFVARLDRPSARRADDEDRPSRRRRDDDDEDDRPSRRRRRDGDDYDDFPRRQKGGGNGLAVASMIVGILSLLIEVPSLVT